MLGRHTVYEEYDGEQLTLTGVVHAVAELAERQHALQAQLGQLQLAGQQPGSELRLTSTGDGGETLALTPEAQAEQAERRTGREIDRLHQLQRKVAA
jgi:hypothetical protein